MPERRESRSFRRFIGFLRPHWKLAVAGGALMLCSVALQLPMPLLTMYLVDHVIPEKNISGLNLIGIGLLGFLVLKAVSAYGQNVAFFAFRNRVMFDVRRRLFLHLERLPLSFFHDHQSGYLTSRLTSDVSQLQGLMASTFVVLLKEGLTFLVGVSVVFWLNWRLATIAVVILPAYVFWLARWNPKVRALRRETQESYARVTGDLLETLSGIYLVKSFLAERRELVKMLKSLRRALRTDFDASMAASWLTIGATSFSALGKLALIWYGSLQIIHGDLSLGGFLAFNSFLRYLFDPADNLVNVNMEIQQSLAAVDRLYELLDQERERDRAPGRRRLEQVRGAIELRDVSFTYDGQREVLKNINLQVEPGTTIAIVGASGSGKSTLVSLLMGFHPPSRGAIFIDGIDLREIDLQSLRKRIAFVPQDTFLFGGDVWSNIRYGDPKASRDKVVRAARLANAHEFIMELPQQYDTEIGERAVRLSGGQRQRLSIAMAFLKNAPVLILDEATSSVDSVAERTIEEAVEKLRSGRTTIVIAHRLSTVKGADVIVVLDQGRIVEVGEHERLLADQGHYHQLYSRYLAA